MVSCQLAWDPSLEELVKQRDRLQREREANWGMGCRLEITGIAEFLGAKAKCTLHLVAGHKEVRCQCSMGYDPPPKIALITENNSLQNDANSMHVFFSLPFSFVPPTFVTTCFRGSKLTPLCRLIPQLLDGQQMCQGFVATGRRAWPRGRGPCNFWRFLGPWTSPFWKSAGWVQLNDLLTESIQPDEISPK